MKVELINNNIFHFIGTQLEITKSFVRLEEFYESPFTEIQGRYFTLGDFKKKYMESGDSDTFTYFTDWAGFNIPGDSVISFRDVFNDLNTKEKFILDTVKKFLDKNNPNFYIIGSIAGKADVVDHEYAHAQYYLNTDYRKECDKILQKIPQGIYTKLKTTLLQLGYDVSKVDDEIQAYFSTSKLNYLVDILLWQFNNYSTSGFINAILRYQDNFDKLPERKRKILIK